MKKKKTRIDQQTTDKLQENIIELDKEIEKLKVELENAKKQVSIDRKSYRSSHENEANIQRILHTKNNLRKKLNQELSRSINPKNSFVLETFFNTFLRCFR